MEKVRWDKRADAEEVGILGDRKRRRGEIERHCLQCLALTVSVATCWREGRRRELCAAYQEYYCQWARAIRPEILSPISPC